MSIKIDDIRLKSHLNNNQTLIFFEKSFLNIILGFTESYSYVLNHIDGFYQLIAVSYKSNKPINISGIDKFHLNFDCISGSITNCTREPISYSFALSSPPGYKIHKETRIELLKKINKPVLSHITFYLEDDDHKPVDVNEEAISFTCQLNKI